MFRAWSPARFTVPLPAGHRFPIAKYAMVRDAVVRRGLLPPEAIEEPGPVAPADLALVHSTGYIDAILHGTLAESAVRRLGLPWSEALRERSLRTVQGTIEAAFDALERGAGINLAGGTHHAFADRGEGFCVFNDVAVALRVLQRETNLGRVAVVDLDVHQGNGTATIFADEASVYTFSMHGATNFPFHKAQSSCDIGLPDGCDDDLYLATLRRHLDPALDAAAAELVFYLGGADPYRDDRLGRLGLTIEGLRQRDEFVFERCRARGLPLVLTMSGGYARDLADVATIHGNSVEALLGAWTPAHRAGATR